MVDSFFCAITGHAPPFVCDLRDTSLVELARPSVQDVLEHVAEVHYLRCGCDVKVGSRVWLTSIPLSDAADCEWQVVSTDCLADDAYVDSLTDTAEPSSIRLVIAGEQAPSEDYLRRYREKRFVPTCVGHARVFTRCGATPVLPPQSSLLFNELCSIPGATFVDKSAPLHDLLEHCWYSRINIIRRPRGFGKTTLLSMFDAFFDFRSTHAYFPFAFTDSSMPIVGAHGQLLVFSLDLAGLSFGPSMHVDELEHECDRLMDAGARQFYTRYQNLLCAPEGETTRPGFSPTFYDIVRWATREEWKLCFTIDNYTAPLLDGPNVAYEWAIVQHIFHRFYNLLHSNTVVTGLIVGEDVPFAIQWDGLPSVFTDLTDNPSFAEVIGFTPAEIAALDIVFPGDLIGALEGRVTTGLAANTNQIYAASDVLALARWLAGSEKSAPGDVRSLAFGPPPAVVSPPPPPALDDDDCTMDDDECTMDYDEDGVDWDAEMDRQYGRWFDNGERGEGDSDEPSLTTDSSSDSSSSSVPSPEAKPSHPLVTEPPSPSQRYDKKFMNSDCL